MLDKITWDELIKRCNLADHELIDWCRNGLLPYSKYTGNIYDCPKEFHLGYHAEVRISELTDQIEKLTKELGKSSTEVSKLRYERSIHENQLDKFINEDPYCRSWKHFTFGRDEEKARELISKLRDHVFFKLDDIEAFEKKYAHVRKSADSRITPQNEQLENIIKMIEFSYENDFEIKIKESGKKAKTFGHDSLGFKNNQTKQWKSFIEILTDPDHAFYLGQTGKKNSSENKSYNARRNILFSLNEKIVRFLKKEYGLQVPEGYKLYEKRPEKGSGVYMFKFGIHTRNLSPNKLAAQFETLTDWELEEEFRNLSEQFKKTHNEEVEAKLLAVVQVAKRKGTLSDKKIQAMLEPIKPTEEYKYEQYGNK